MNTFNSQAFGKLFERTKGHADFCGCGACATLSGWSQEDDEEALNREYEQRLKANTLYTLKAFVGDSFVHIVDTHVKVVYEGSYAQCVQWVKDHNLKEITQRYYPNMQMLEIFLGLDGRDVI